MEEGAQTGALRPEDAGGAAAPPREKRKGTGTAMRKESNGLAGAGKKPATVACASSRAKGSKSKAKAPRGSNRSKPHVSSLHAEFL